MTTRALACALCVLLVASLLVFVPATPAAAQTPTFGVTSSQRDVEDAVGDGLP